MRFTPREVGPRGSDGAAVRLRPIAETDAPGLHELTRCLAEQGVGVVMTAAELPPDDGETRRQIRENLESGRGLWIVAEHGPGIAGEARLEVTRWSRLRHRAWFSVGVHPEHQGRGLGRALTEAALDWARDAGLQRVELGVFASNARARTLYEHCGFVAEGVRRRFVRYEDGRYDDDVMMAWLAPDAPGPGTVAR